MKYWVFINDDIMGPMGIEEISSKSYLSRDLLVCPSESSGVSSSNWYFAKELPEFEKYLNRSNVMLDEGLDTKDIMDSISYLIETETRNKNNFEENIKCNEMLIENNILKEKLDIKEKENSNYKNKISFLELKINDIQKKLDSTLEIIKDYENRLKNKDAIIDRLSKEVDEIKNQKKEYKEFKTDFVNLDSILDRSSNDFEPEKNINIIKNEIEIKGNIGSSINDFKQKEIDLGEEEKIEKHQIKESISPAFEEPMFIAGTEEKNKDSVKSDNANQEFVCDQDKTMTVDFKPEIKKVFPTEEKTDNSFDPFSGSLKKLNLVEMQQIVVDNQSEVVENYNNMVEMKLEYSPLEKDTSIFQVADVKLEVAKGNMDVVETKNIEMIASQNPQNTMQSASPESVEAKEETLDKTVKPVVFSISDSKNNTESPEAKYKIKKEQVLSRGIEIPKAEMENKAGGRVSQEKYSQRKIIKMVLKIMGISGFIVFFAFSIIYILKSDSSSTIQTSSLFSKPKFSKETFKDQVEPSTQTRISTSGELNVSKINENVRKSIDIVKNYNLDDGKGKMHSWFSNTFSVSNQVREEWNATFLSGNLFVVQYRVLRYKQEPIIYLFEVDVEKNNIVRGINNNAIDLLSGKGSVKKNTAKARVNTKKINENIEKDEDMF